MRRWPFQTQAEENIEDEEAEAAELCRMLMDGEHRTYAVGMETFSNLRRLDMSVCCTPRTNLGGVSLRSSFSSAKDRQECKEYCELTHGWMLTVLVIDNDNIITSLMRK